MVGADLESLLKRLLERLKPEELETLRVVMGAIRALDRVELEAVVFAVLVAVLAGQGRKR